MSETIRTKIFLDSGDPKETADILGHFGTLDGQTTNPSLFAKNPQVQARLATGKKYDATEVLVAYKQVVSEISRLLPQGSVSVEVYADAQTPAEQILNQAREMNTWIPNAHIKIPVTRFGLEAAEILIKEGIRLNLTLVFSQEQAAAVYAATRGAKPGQVFLSPFIGRLDDIGLDGISLIANILRLYSSGDGHVQVLAASVRTYEHFLQTLKLNCDLVTVPGKILLTWLEQGKNMPSADWVYSPAGFKVIPWEEITLTKSWPEYNFNHELTDKGLEKFAADWNNLVKV